MKSPRRHTQETKTKMSLAHTGKVISPQTRKKIAKALAGHQTSKATRAKMRQAKLGHKVSAETRQRIRDALKLRQMVRKKMGKPARKMTPAELRRHKAMLHERKPWLSPKFIAGREDATLNRKLVKALKPRRKKRAYQWRQYLHR